MEHAESLITQAILAIKLIIEVAGVVVIAIGSASALIQLVQTWRRRTPSTFTSIRLTLARYLALALELQLAADIIMTALAPTWEEIGKLAAIAAIRTALNFFLSREVKEERAEELAERAERQDERPAAP